MLGNKQYPHAAAESLSLEELLAERIASEAARIAEERIKVAFEITEFTPTRFTAS